MVNYLIKHRHVIHLHGKSNLSSDPVIVSTLELARQLKVKEFRPHLSLNHDLYLSLNPDRYFVFFLEIAHCRCKTSKCTN